MPKTNANTLAGSGRTLDALRALKTGAVYIVHDRKIIDYCRHLSEDILRRDDIKFVPMEVAEIYLRGRRLTDYAFDHDVLDRARRDKEYLMQMERVRMYAEAGVRTPLRVGEGNAA